MTVCDTKILYDTEFEAQLAVAKHVDEMTYYRCPGTRHYHLTHKRKQERLGHGKTGVKCPECNRIMSKKEFKQHDHGRIPEKTSNSR